MAQKNKVKELVGRGLNSYHTKALQQMDRIEKKNKEQNHKISILSNELDNDYLTKTEEGSVVSLEHSKEGMVYLDELQGNTLVNYCVDGAKEFTLNDDINEFGTAVKLTETVDDGQVDVLAEGNTMVNVCDQKEPVAITKSYTVETGNHVALQGEYDGKCRPVPTGNTLVNLHNKQNDNYPQLEINTKDSGTTRIPAENGILSTTVNSAPNWYFVDCGRPKLDMLKPNTVYSIIFNQCEGISNVKLMQSNATNIISSTSNIVNNIATVTTKSDFTGIDTSNIIIYASPKTTYPNNIKIDTPIILEGDYTNKPIPDYFTGMQSSFEDKVVPENLSDIPNVETATTLGGRAWTTTNLMPAGEYTFIFTAKTSNSVDKRIQIGVTDTPYIGNQSEFGSYLYTYTNISSEYFTYATKITLSESKYVGIRLVGAGGCFKDVYLVEGDYTNYDFSDYDSTKAGKYKVEYKVTGKNKLNNNRFYTGSYKNGIENNWAVYGKTDFIPVFPNTTYTSNIPTYNGIVANFRDVRFGFYDINKVLISCNDSTLNYTFTTPNNCYYMKASHKLVQDGGSVNTSLISNWQIEEGSTATAYEPYKESIKTYYLNSPLLEGDTIEESGNDVVHVHRYGKVVLDGSENWEIHKIGEPSGKNAFKFIINNTLQKENVPAVCDKLRYELWSASPWTINSDLISICGTANRIYFYTDYTTISEFKTYLQSNPVTVVYQLASPTYEVISQNDSILTDSYVAGHLDFDTAVPVEKVKFNGFGSWVKYLYPSTEYIVQFESDNVGKLSYIGLNWKAYCSDENVVKGINKFRVLIDSTINSGFFEFSGIGFSASNIVVTEATDKDFGYFSGMKSVGELEENKIEILSKNKNLFKNASLSTKTSWETFNGTIVEGINNNKGIYSEHIQTTHGYYDFLQQSIFLKDNINNAIKNDTWYTFSFYAKGTGKVRTHIYPKAIDTSIKGFVNGVEKNLQPDGNCNWELTNEWIRHSYTFKTRSNINDMGTHAKALFRLMPSDTDILNTVTISCPMLEEGKVATNFVNDLSNKKEILMNEPLRGDYRLRDRVVKINGKFYIERNTIEYSSNELIDRLRFEGVYPNGRTARLGCDAFLTGGRRQFNICDKYKTKQVWDGDEEGIWADHNLKISLSVEKGNDADSLKEYLRNNPFKIVLEREKPTYEPLEVEPVLNTYNDVTHISNNSIIPCNMKIQNTGYNAIIKPNTLYTVALDTNKNGTIGMNLGGAKGTTTNNVATITTPATLSDDSLRLYGKGIKGSKVRLLEGDKTNWIPSHFEGMKSSFEDKVQEDGSYKMEILMNNENLLDLSQHSIGTPYTRQYKIENNTITGTYVGDNYTDFQLWFKLKRNKAYKLSWDAESSYILNGNNSQILKGKLNGYNGDNVLHSSYDTNRGIISNVPCDGWYTLHFHSMKNNQFIKNLQLKEVAYSTDFVERKYNKIQFSSIEPLRKWDKFIFKDGRLIIERRSATFTLNSKNGYGLSAGGWENKTDVCTFEHYKPTPTAILDNTIKHYADTVPSLTFHQQWTESGSKGREGISTHQQGGFVLSIKRSKLKTQDVNGLDEYLRNNPIKVTYQTVEPTYEEIPFELQKIILEGYENGTLFIDTNIPPTSTVTYAGETPIVKATKLNKTEVLNNTEDINDNIIPYLMDMDYRVVMLQLATEELEGGVSMARLFGGTYEMIKRDILSKRLTREEYGYRLADYFNAGKLTEEQVRELEELR